MTATATRPVITPAATTRPSLWKTGACAGASAAAATVAVAGAASAIGVSLDIAGEPIPLLAFAHLTLICTFVGGSSPGPSAGVPRSPATGWSRSPSP